MRHPRWPGLMISAVLVALGVSSCGARTPYALPVEVTDGGTTPVPASCGDGTCGERESCTNCGQDCGFCVGCGDGSCLDGETCGSCPGDCGVCGTCGDGFCKPEDGESCQSCAPDCGTCPGCGDGTCGDRESCFTCPADCGKCAGCGDGSCSATESCASCDRDCGVCAVCGNDKCEPPFETCSNCHKDCGDCDPLGCFSMLSCSLKCIDLNARPIDVRVSCVGDCVATGCASARFFFDNAFNCILQHLEECRGDFGCYTRVCKGEVGACLGSRCDTR